METHPYLIDLGTTPRIPHEGWRLKAHAGAGTFFCDPSRIQLYSPERLLSIPDFSGEDFLREMADKPILNANVRDFLQTHPECISASWREPLRGRIPCILFPATIFLDRDGIPRIPRLQWIPPWQDRPGRWDSGEEYIGRVLKYSLQFVALMVIPQELPRVRLID